MSRNPEQEEQDGFVRGYHGIPFDDELSKMSFVELASALSSAEKDSPKFIVLERELKKHLAKDQAKSNRSNIVLGACIGLVGVFIGSFIKSAPSCNEVSPTNSVQQLSNSDFTVKEPVASVAPIAQPIIAPEKPTPVSNNAQPSQAKP